MWWILISWRWRACPQVCLTQPYLPGLRVHTPLLSVLSVVVPGLPPPASCLSSHESQGWQSSNSAVRSSEFLMCPYSDIVWYFSDSEMGCICYFSLSFGLLQVILLICLYFSDCFASFSDYLATSTDRSCHLCWSRRSAAVRLSVLLSSSVHSVETQILIHKKRQIQNTLPAFMYS